MAHETTKPHLTSRYFEVLSEAGYRPRVESASGEPSVIAFRSEGDGYLLLVEERDPGFFHLASALEIDDADLDRALARANDVNEELKGVKVTVFPPDGSVRFHVECFLEGPATLQVIERAVTAIRLAVRRFSDRKRTPVRLDA